MTVSIGTAVADTFLETRTVREDEGGGAFVFDGLNATRAHFVKLEGAGYVGKPSLVIDARNGESVSNESVVTVALTATAAQARRRMTSETENAVFEYHWACQIRRRCFIPNNLSCFRLHESQPETCDTQHFL